MRATAWLVAAIGLSGNVHAMAAEAIPATVVHFDNGTLHLGGELYKPPGDGPFPAVVYNHGSACCMWNRQASENIGPLFAKAGWVFFMPYRRGQGLSLDAGPYILDQIKQARRAGGKPEADATATRLLAEDHLSDQLAALRWLRAQAFVQPERVAVAGSSFGGVETVFGAARAEPAYCAAADASGGAESWDDAPKLQQAMQAAVRASRSPIYFFQAENDYDLTPSRLLLDVAKAAGHDAEMKIYPAFGSSSSNCDGHSFSWLGANIWFDDVFAFMQKHCPANSAPAHAPG